MEKKLINDRIRVSKVSWKFRISIINNFVVIDPWKVPYFLTVSIVFFCLQTKVYGSITSKQEQCLWFVLKRSYIYYSIICMTVPLNKQWICFVNRRDWIATKHLLLCELQFEEILTARWKMYTTVVDDFCTHCLSLKTFK